MNEKNLRTVEISALTVSILVTVWAMLRASAWTIDGGILLFILWAISPYICVFFAGLLLRKLTSNSRLPLVSCIISLLLLVATLGFYVGTMNDTSSTYSLIFLAIPIYLYIGSFFLLTVNIIIWLLQKKFQKR